MRTISFIGCGRLGQTLGILFHDHQIFHIQDVLCQSAESASAAVATIGSGKPVWEFSKLVSADIFLIATPDSQIKSCCDTLVQNSLLKPGNLIFHASGAKSSELLREAKEVGCSIASFHPARSFAEPQKAAEQFPGTSCAMEGDEEAISILKPVFEKLGAEVFSIQVKEKILYHAATVMASNYLVALVEAALQVAEKAGLERVQAEKFLAPLLQGALDNTLRLGTTTALTGPISRGEFDVVQQQLRELSQWDARLGRLYRDLGAVALGLALRQGRTEPSLLDNLQELLD